MKQTDDRVYDVDGKLVYARRSNDSLEFEQLFPGPGEGVPRRRRLETFLLESTDTTL